MADAVLIEAYADEVHDAQETDVYAFVTSNSDDFSLTTGDKRLPHGDISATFDGVRSIFALGVDGLDAVMRGYFGDVAKELFDEVDFREEPRRLDEILSAEKELFDRIWYHRSLQHDYHLANLGDYERLSEHKRVAGPGRHRVEAAYTEPGQLGPYTDFELGMLHGKMSALRWVIGSEWDFLDT